MKTSITRLTEYAQQIGRTKDKKDIIELSLSRKAIVWLLDDLSKRGKRILQSVHDDKTKPTKREKRERELYMLAYVVDILINGLNK